MHNYRRAARVILLCAVLLLLWFSLALFYVSVGNEEDTAVPSDVILVLGCPTYQGNVVSNGFSACLRARAHHAAELYRRGLAARIIPTGGLTGPPPTEAEAMRRLLMAGGVSDSAITIEDHARDTVENMQNSRAIMKAHGWRTAILVTEPHHIRRAAVIAHDAGLNVTLSPVTESAGWNAQASRSRNLLRDAFALMTYQVRRVRSGPP